MSNVWIDWEGGKQDFTTDKKSAQEATVYYEGTDDINAAANAIYGFLPSTVPDLFSNSGTLALISATRVQRIGIGYFSATAKYADKENSNKKNPPALGEFKISFDISSITQKLKFSQTGHFTKYLDPALLNIDPNPNGLLGFKKKDGKIESEGVDVRVPAMKYKIAYRMPKAQLTTDYSRFLRAKLLTTNASPFLGWGAKELLFTGAQGSQSVWGDPELEFEFETDIEATYEYASIPTVTKPPHDYLELVFDQEPADSRIVAKPIAAYVHNFYGTSDFASLFGFGP